MKHVAAYLRRVALLEGGCRPTDGELLEAFLAQRDEAAFEALLRRHGPMVLGVCQRTLQNPHDAEDAFQATFLVLVRKASTIRPREMIGNWLYGVACRTAMKARAMNTRRRVKESNVQEIARPTNGVEVADDKVLTLLDEEISRLPDKYRAPVVLCELEGKSRKEVAGLLGVPEGTLSWRLASARKMLGRRLSRRGVTFSTGALAAALSVNTGSAAVPPLLLNSTAKAALRIAAGQALTAVAASTQVVILTEGVLKAMLLSKLKVFLAVAFAVVIGTTVTGLGYQALAGDPPQARGTAQRARASQDELEELRLDVEVLRKGLQATRERVRSLEDELQSLKQRPMGGAIGLGGGGGGLGGGAIIGGGMGNIGFGGGQFGLAGGAIGQTGGGGQFGLAGSANVGRAGGGRMGLADTPSQDPHGNQYKASAGRSNPKPRNAKVGAAYDPLADVEKALMQLRQDPGNKQAAEALDRASQFLKSRGESKQSSEQEKPH
jgi:RNA polymerase sigma factor (sigma-70 family)